jgi:CelD/BcsL family acetyltransferase involved in cellulose biosynthesis/glycosyltransferase involved in cell wall biosynthesis
MPLRVLNVAYPLAPVGPDAVGGAEQVLAMIDAALVRAGHESLVLACTGSRVRGELIASGPLPSVFDDAARAAAAERHRRAITELIATRGIDIVHLHGIDFLDYMPEAGPPIVVTLHLPLDWYAPEALAVTRDDVQLVCVSEHQRVTRPDGTCALITIENGVDLDAFAPIRRKRRFTLALARICEEKGLHVALDAAHAAGATLLIGGQAFGYPEHRKYLNERVAPRLDRRRRWLGALALPRKRRLLAAARCLLVPSLAQETSSLVAMEALASGTPVVALRNGALPSLIEHGRTGFIVDDAAGMARAIADAAQLRPEHCRAAAERRFSAYAMTRRYLALYAELATRRLPRIRREAIALEPIGTLSELEALADEWASLWERTPHASMFQRPEWIVPWCRAFGVTELRTVALRRAGRLIGLAPLHVRKHAGARVLELLGTGVSDYPDVLIDPSGTEEATRALFRWIAEDAGFDACAFDCLRADSALLHAPAPRRFDDGVEPAEVAPVLDLRTGLAAWFTELPRIARTNLRRGWNRASRLGLTRDHGDGDGAEYFSALVALHGACWSARGQAGVLAAAETQSFHRAVIAAFAARGMLAFRGLRCAGRLVAVVYGFRDRGTERLYLSGFDPELAGSSVGTLAVHHAIECAAERGADEVDFMRGAEPYKYMWGARDRMLYRRRLTPHVRAQDAAPAPARRP